MAKTACVKKLPCGHRCMGSKDEVKCVPCIQADCPSRDTTCAKTESDFCFCWISGLGDAPCVRLTSCNHVMHYDCVKRLIQQKWLSPRIVFKFLECPECNTRMEAKNNPELQALIDESVELEKKIQKIAVERAQIEGLQNDPKFNTPGYAYYGNLPGFAMFKCAFYMCFKCKNPYFGGLKDCDANQ